MNSQVALLMLLIMVCRVDATFRQVCLATKGFGSSSKSVKKSGAPVQLSKEARNLLKKYGNNVDAASAGYYKTQMEQIEQGSMEEMHTARVTATWNTVALFLPQDYQRNKGKVEPSVERRLRHIASACQGNKDDDFELLDVGCGDGALVPYLPDNCRFNGLDLSPEMIALANQRCTGKNFWVGEFPQNVPAGSLYDAVVFNGSIQFFRETRLAIEEAASLLKPCGRIVLSHVNGAKFVKDECKKNPSVAVRTMPNNRNLEVMAAVAGLKILEKSKLQLVDYDESLDGGDEDFYLVVLEKFD
jgi:SAM-dependent methyltransferase